MSFRFSSDQDSDVYKTLGSLVKYNGGFFKSAKQANFVLSPKFSWQWSSPAMCEKENIHARQEANALDYFGIDRFNAHVHTMFSVSATTQWSPHGGRSIMPVGWMFVCDRFGVVAQYKLGFHGNLRSGSGPDPAKTKLVWSRPADAVLPALYEEEEKRVAAAKAADAAKTFVGAVGERREFKAKIVATRQFEGQRFSYYDSGLRTMTVLEDEQGNKLIYWNNVGSKGETIRFKATVKSHDEYKGVKQTTLSRAKVLESFGGGEDQMENE